MRVSRLIKVCLSEVYSNVWIDKYFCYLSYLEWFEARRCLIAMGLSFALEYTIRNVEANQTD